MKDPKDPKTANFAVTRSLPWSLPPKCFAPAVTVAVCSNFRADNILGKTPEIAAKLGIGPAPGPEKLGRVRVGPIS